MNDVVLLYRSSSGSCETFRPTQTCCWLTTLLSADMRNRLLVVVVVVTAWDQTFHATAHF